MLPRFFVDHPVFAWVIAIIIMMLGIAGLTRLPVEQYPDIAPPSVNVRAKFPGASAETLEASVTQIIEQQLAGIDGMIYFSASSNSAGTAQVTVTFEKGTDPDIAQVQVQNKVQQALPRLPQSVQQQGLTVTKANPDFLMVLALYDPTDRATSQELGDYLASNLQDQVARVPGVGETNLFGSQHAMRIWLDPFKLAAVQLIPQDVVGAVQAQNTQVAAGEIGGQPQPLTQMLNATVTSRSRLTSPEQFRAIILKTRPDGSVVRLQDVARVELGSESYSFISKMNDHPSVGMSISLAPGADALRTAKLVKELMEREAKALPVNYAYTYPYDVTPFIKLSINEVIKTLIEAIILVVILMFLFLQSWRATLIPAIVVPVVLLGTFGILAVAGYSINTLTLFAMVLAIGLLVDDAIVIVESVERVMHENPDISPREATLQAMSEINTALVAIALVLSAVFLPMAFFGGSTGVIYRQFSITIVSTLLLSLLLALTLSPALAATWLKRRDPDADEPAWLERMHGYGGRFNDWFARLSDRYRTNVSRIISHRRRPALGIYGVVLAMLAGLLTYLPTSFMPSEDQGRSMFQFSLPAGATLGRAIEVNHQINQYFKAHESDNIVNVFNLSGFSTAGSGQNAGRGFVSLKHWDERPGKANSAEAIADRANKAFPTLFRDAQVYAFDLPPIRGLGQSTGFSMQLLNRDGLPHEEFVKLRDDLLAAARKDPDLAAVRVNTLEDTPSLKVDVDQAKVGALGLSQQQVDSTLAIGWGGIYVNDFVDKGRVKRVYVQGDMPYRSKPEDLSTWFVRSADGQMTPYSAIARTSWSVVANSLPRFNGLPAYEIQGQAAPGKSSGTAMMKIENLARAMPGVGVAWSGLSYQERLAGAQAPLLYAVSLMVVFLCLAALYESWTVPLSVMLVIPLGLIGAAMAVALRGLSNDVYFQVGLLTTMGLAAKNAILIVEFAEAGYRSGREVVDATLDAVRLRFRPIMMTSLAILAGVMPLAFSGGAGSKSRIAIGTAVAGGTITATALAIFFVPLFFVLVRQRFPGRPHDKVAA